MCPRILMDSEVADIFGTNLFLDGGCQHEGIQGPAQVLLLLIDDAQPLVAVREVWRQPDDLLEAGDGLVKPAAIVALLLQTYLRIWVLILTCHHLDCSLPSLHWLQCHRLPSTAGCEVCLSIAP